MDTQDIEPYNYAWHCGALQGLLMMLPYRLYAEGMLPIDALKDADRFVQEQLDRISKEAKTINK